MAFNSANFSNQGESGSFPGRIHQFAYVGGPDTLAAIDADPHYFDSLSNILRKYDYILVIDINGLQGFYSISGVNFGSSVSFAHLI